MVYHHGQGLFTVPSMEVLDRGRKNDRLRLSLQKFAIWHPQCWYPQPIFLGEA